MVRLTRHGRQQAQGLLACGLEVRQLLHVLPADDMALAAALPARDVDLVADLLPHSGLVHALIHKCLHGAGDGVCVVAMGWLVLSQILV